MDAHSPRRTQLWVATNYGRDGWIYEATSNSRTRSMPMGRLTRMHSSQLQPRTVRRTRTGLEIYATRQQVPATLPS